MKFTILSLFPEQFEPFFGGSILGKAVGRGIVEHELVNIRDFATDRHRTCDDYPYGGGAGMVFKPEPLAAALDSVGAKDRHVIYPSPSGRLFTQVDAKRISEMPGVVLVCGRYEGIDQRVIDTYVDEELSVGDYVLSSGDLAAMVIVDAVFRLLPGVLNAESLAEESHVDGLLEYPHYTRPEVFLDKQVPEVLLSGNHELIARWRRTSQLVRTRSVRPDIFEKLQLGEKDKALLEEFDRAGGRSWI